MIESIVKELIKRNWTISTMESCTGGLLSSMITDVPGASAVFPGGFVTYLNEVKVMMGVDKAVIEQCGVYSGECARAMASTAGERFRTKIAIGITGTTGNPDPNNKDSVIGQAFFCIQIDDKRYDYEINEKIESLSRHEIKELYANRVWEALQQLIAGK